MRKKRTTPNYIDQAQTPNIKKIAPKIVCKHGPRDRRFFRRLSGEQRHTIKQKTLAKFGKTPPKNIDQTQTPTPKIRTRNFSAKRDPQQKTRQLLGEHSHTRKQKRRQSGTKKQRPHTSCRTQKFAPEIFFANKDLKIGEYLRQLFFYVTQ